MNKYADDNLSFMDIVPPAGLPATRLVAAALGGYVSGDSVLVEQGGSIVHLVDVVVDRDTLERTFTGDVHTVRALDGQLCYRRGWSPSRLVTHRVTPAQLPVLLACSVNALPAAARPAAAYLRRKDQARVPAGSSTGGEFAGSQEMGDSAKSVLAKRHAVYVGKDVQRYAEEHNEPSFAKAVGGKSLRDNEPVDIVCKYGGVELKTMVSNTNDKITMKTPAIMRKLAWVKQNKMDFHTVVYDDRRVFNAGGAGKHDESKRDIYYRRGWGSGRVGGMYKCKDVAELKRLMATPTKDLPDAAKPASNVPYPKVKEFDPDLHPKDEKGRFTHGGSAGKDVTHPALLSGGKYLGGSTGATLKTDEEGNKFVVKKGASEGHLRNEFTTDKVYAALGIDVPHARLDTHEGTATKTSVFKEGATPYGQLAGDAKEAARQELRKGFVADAVLGNWDVIGKGGDNVLVGKDGSVTRIDNGGALRYRAMGSLKSDSQFGAAVTELKTMQDPMLNKDAAGVFKGMSAGEIRVQAIALEAKRDDILKAIDDPKTRDVVRQRLDWMKENVIDANGPKLAEVLPPGTPAYPGGPPMTPALAPYTKPVKTVAEVNQGNGKIDHGAFEAGGYKVSKAVDVSHPAVKHLTSQIRALNSAASKLEKGSKEHTANRAAVEKFRAERKDVFHKQVLAAAGGSVKVPVMDLPPNPPKTWQSPGFAAAKDKYEAAQPKTAAPKDDGFRAKTVAEFGVWRNKPENEAAKSALSSWVGSGSSSIRSAQRAAGDTGKLSSKVVAFERACAAAPPPSKDATIWRGMHGMPADALKDFTTVGNIITPSCHESWSLSKSVGAGFAGLGSNHTDDKGNLIEPYKGSYNVKAVILKMDKATQGGANLGKYGLGGGHEQEVIVPKKTSYEITKVVKLTAKDGVDAYEVHVKEVDNG